MSSKASTGLVGLAVNPSARLSLVNLYRQTLQVLGGFPQSAVYRQHAEKLTNHRLSILDQEPSDDAAERRINSGQMEELVRQAEDELALAKKMGEWKAWEKLSVQPNSEQWKWP
ncbi:NADH dehydrogenase 1 alpha subcomplex subunit 5 [Capsaspora owczarzaki ATCC 30864]|uniref:NADH dehydrogenase 1 alpha subcomplex subunit 5 n=1 Tax=Capsaspora owczarzaki (strain ATCC 30864) TaxID=595528 RepID=A0A0D2UA00_CAPO3|nr:NADH dehydrogenase 1 alpha subcomplex subunit 5 [Capsaspora owczarzaki ATCC 30864]KJE91886.1 NADH dehydrogenase 1 alpha subcomplex subunit 5 [Capsaspora owczarzaki ATCC 30864]|eukprot:XP_004363789.1 NADH dehydrogenase 1 alpha subcomplex subunit 5 [Capsaspora owczarzaki ATCC 30864]